MSGVSQTGLLISMQLPNVSGVHASARSSFVELHQLFAFLEQPKEWRQGSHVESMCADGHDVVQDSRDLSEQH